MIDYPYRETYKRLRMLCDGWHMPLKDRKPTLCRWRGVTFADLKAG